LSFPSNKTKEIQGKPRKKAWISLDSLGRIGAFQVVTANPNEKVPFPWSHASLAPVASRAMLNS
jgi:hypothetical protein